MPPMPYYLEKGPFLSVLESYVNGSGSRSARLLRTLRIPRGSPGFTELWDLPPFQSTTLQGKPPPSYADDFRAKWCGMGPGQQGATMWLDYEGDVEGITRLTLRTALEVSLGVDADTTEVPESPDRHWPIECFWKCGQNWFEGWVAFRNGGAGPHDGHVSITFCTPSEGSIILDRPADHPRVRQSADFAVNPTSTRLGGVERKSGLMVVTHRHNRATPSFGMKVTPVGATFEVVLNPTKYVGRDGLVVVAPSEVDGGVLADPRPYVQGP